MHWTAVDTQPRILILCAGIKFPALDVCLPPWASDKVKVQQQGGRIGSLEDTKIDSDNSHQFPCWVGSPENNNSKIHPSHRDVTFTRRHKEERMLLDGDNSLFQSWHKSFIWKRFYTDLTCSCWCMQDGSAPWLSKRLLQIRFISLLFLTR